MRKVDKIAYTVVAVLGLVAIILSVLSLVHVALVFLTLMMLAVSAILLKKAVTNRRIVTKLQEPDREPIQLPEELMLQIQAADTKKILSSIEALRASTDQIAEQVAELNELKSTLGGIDLDEEEPKKP